MKDVITNILTDPKARSNLAVETMVIQAANVAAPWGDANNS